jgi:hypothetical protein
LNPLKHMERHLLFIPVVSAALAAAGAPSGARAANGVSVFVEPSVGFTAVTLKALEIETAFIRAEVDENGDPIETDDWENVDPTEFQATVGRRAYYEGTGFSCGVSGGVRLFAIQIGAAYTFDTLTLDGFSKRYRYMPEKLRAGGRKFLDDGRADFHRVEVLLRYILPIWKIQLEFQTRLGGIFIDEGPLIVGRAIREQNGFTGDLGIGIGVSPVKFLTVRVAGYYGFYTFSGDYEGAYGTLGGLTFSVVLSI